LQMVGERQVHRLPEDAAAQAALARAMGFSGDDPTAPFLLTLEAHRVEIRELFNDLFAADGTARLLDLFQRTVPQLVAQPGTRAQIEQLAEHFARAIEASPDAERAMSN